MEQITAIAVINGVVLVLRSAAKIIAYLPHTAVLDDSIEVMNDLAETLEDILKLANDIENQP